MVIWNTSRCVILSNNNVYTYIWLNTTNEVDIIMLRLYHNKKLHGGRYNHRKIISQ